MCSWCEHCIKAIEKNWNLSKYKNYILRFYRMVLLVFPHYHLSYREVSILSSVSLPESNEAYSSNVTWCFEEYSDKISTFQSLQRFSVVTYSICCCDSQVKLVLSLIPVQSCAGAKLASLLVDGKLGWQCVSRAWTQVVAYSTKRTTVLICGRYLRGKETRGKIDASPVPTSLRDT